MTPFPNPISKILSEQLNAVMAFYAIKETEEIELVLVPNLLQEKLNNQDEGISFWQTPMISGRRISIEKSLEFLATAFNTAPIWIKTYYTNKLLILEFSQRFRKFSVIKEAHPNNTFAPFQIGSIETFDMSRIDERSSIIKGMLFGGMMSDLELQKLNAVITKKEFLDFLEEHFESYRYYPQLYNHHKLGDRNYSTLVIEKDHEKNTFSLFKNDKFQTNILSNKSLTDIALVYLEKELNWKFGEIHIERNEVGSK